MNLEEQALREMEDFLLIVQAKLKEDAEIRKQTVAEMRAWLNARKA